MYSLLFKIVTIFKDKEQITLRKQIITMKIKNIFIVSIKALNKKTP
ncbi:MAG: hypothetical protein IKG14_05465 [Clostridia bacterium]|nr:hypothetical protein [Clostridia bacterium]